MQIISYCPPGNLCPSLSLNMKESIKKSYYTLIPNKPVLFIFFIFRIYVNLDIFVTLDSELIVQSGFIVQIMECHLLCYVILQHQKIVQRKIILIQVQMKMVQ
jgi:hypothetical protein